MRNKFLLVLIFIVVTISLYFAFYMYSNIQNQYCYQNCSDFHLSGDSTHWEYTDYIVDQADTIWIDQECYNEWCICIDECKPGLCCDLLNSN